MTARELWRRAWHFDRQQVLAAQMALLERNLPYAHFITIAVAWLTALAAHHFLHAQAAWGWAGFTTVVELVAQLARSKLPDPTDPAHALRYAQGVRSVPGTPSAGLGRKFIT